MLHIYTNSAWKMLIKTPKPDEKNMYQLINIILECMPTCAEEIQYNPLIWKYWFSVLHQIGKPPMKFILK